MKRPSAGLEDSELPWLETEKLVAKLRAPLTVLWAWPGGGEELWVEKLSRQSGACRIEDPGKISERLGASSGFAMGLLSAMPEPAELERVIGDLRPAARLVLAGSPRPEVGAIPHGLIRPEELTLDREQLSVAAAEIAPGIFSAPDLDSLHRKTRGWLEPTLYCLRRRTDDPILWFRDSILGVFDSLERQVLAEIVALTLDGDDVPVDLWRRFYRQEAPKLAAVERLISAWGLVTASGSSGGPGGLAPILRDALASEAEQVAAIDSTILRRFAGVSAELGCHGLAARSLERAGEAAAATRFRRAADVMSGTRSSETSQGAPSTAGLSGLRRAASPSGAVYQVRLLGPPSVSKVDGAGGEEEIHWRLHRSMLTIARLALAPDHRLPRDELVEALWPESSADHVRRNFHPTLSATRRALGGGRGGGLVQRHGIYALDPASTWRFDFEVFEAHLGGAASEDFASAKALTELEAAWFLYRGPLLDGFDAEWLDEPRRLYHEHYLNMLRQLGDLASSLGRETLALDAYRRLLLEEPFEERIHLQLMGIYGRRGRRDLVRRQFVHLQELLKDLHAEPEEETIERYHQLMR